MNPSCHMQSKASPASSGISARHCTGVLTFCRKGEYPICYQLETLTAFTRFCWRLAFCIRSTAPGSLVISFHCATQVFQGPAMVISTSRDSHIVHRVIERSLLLAGAEFRLRWIARTTTLTFESSGLSQWGYEPTCSEPGKANSVGNRSGFPFRSKQGALISAAFVTPWRERNQHSHTCV
jgi:hypothetical protein